MAEPQTTAPSRLEILKALGENTRYAIYLELARSSRPLATAEIATTLDLHANTVRPHLERMREVGLLDQRIDNNGGVGRPQHLYSLAPDAPPRPQTETAIDGFYLAGDWIDTGLPATIESAVVSGHRAADVLATKNTKHTKTH